MTSLNNQRGQAASALADSMPNSFFLNVWSKQLLVGCIKCCLMGTHDDQPGIHFESHFEFHSQLNRQHDLVLPYAERVYGSILRQPKHARSLCNAKLDSICREECSQDAEQTCNRSMSRHLYGKSVRL